MTPIEAMAKQEPMPVKDMIISFFPHSSLIKNVYGKCPMCNSVQSEDNYCANYGQRLDFSIVKENELPGSRHEYTDTHIRITLSENQGGYLNEQIYRKADW